MKKNLRKKVVHNSLLIKRFSYLLLMSLEAIAAVSDFTNPTLQAKISMKIAILKLIYANY
jgi:hypothetical protein